jgi:hypothetical protein
VTVTLDPVLPAADAGVVADGRQADPEVPERARRRAFTSSRKLEILAAYDAAEPGKKGALLRREGLYSSHIVEWRRARDAGALADLAQPRGRERPDLREAKIAALEREGQRLERELARARFVVDVQAKLPVEALRERGHRAEVNAMTDEAVAGLIAGARIETLRSHLPVRLSCFGAVPPGSLLGGCV